MAARKGPRKLYRYSAEFKPSAPVELSGRKYSGHALDLMHEQGYDSTAIETVIAKGRPAHVGANTAYFSGDLEDLPFGIIVDASGRVVTII